MATSVSQSSPVVARKTRRTIPAVWMRAGTSKGLFLHRRDLPARREDWASIILPVMGSQDGDPRQLSGVGGATSTTSKVAVVERSTRLGIDIEYTFVQVGIGGPSLDFTGNCGNIASGVGPFALDEGLVVPEKGQRQAVVRILNTNTDRVLRETLDLDADGHFLEDGDYLVPGTMSTGSSIAVAFEMPAGAMTGTLLPSGSPVDDFSILDTSSSNIVTIRASLVDAANPFVFVDSTSIPPHVACLGYHDPVYLSLIEAVRQAGAVRMGLAKDLATAALTRGTPKVAVLYAPKVDMMPDPTQSPDVKVTSFSMGKLHGSLQLTGAVCLGTAVCTKGTIAHKIAEQARGATVMPRGGRRDSGHDLSVAGERKVVIQHPGGVIGIDISATAEGVALARLSRTARRLFQGSVCYLA